MAQSFLVSYQLWNYRIITHNVNFLPILVNLRCMFYQFVFHATTECTKMACFIILLMRKSLWKSMIFSQMYKGHRNIFCKSSTGVLFLSVPSASLDCTQFWCTSLVCFPNPALVSQVNSHWLHDSFCCTWLFLSNPWSSFKWEKTNVFLFIQKVTIKWAVEHVYCISVLTLGCTTFDNFIPTISSCFFLRCVWHWQNFWTLWCIMFCSQISWNLFHILHLKLYKHYVIHHLLLVHDLLDIDLYLHLSVHYHHDLLHFLWNVYQVFQLEVNINEVCVIF